jgi:hypothetical protein
VTDLQRAAGSSPLVKFQMAEEKGDFPDGGGWRIGAMDGVFLHVYPIFLAQRA